MNLYMDARSGSAQAVRYPQARRFALEDGAWLLAPVTWLGYPNVSLLVATVCPALFALRTRVRVV